MAVITIEQPVTHNLLISYIYLLLCVCRRPTLVGYVITITRRLGNHRCRAHYCEIDVTWVVVIGKNQNWGDGFLFLRR